MRLAASLFAIIALTAFGADERRRDESDERWVRDEEEVHTMAPFVLNESLLEARLGAWSYARSGQCEVLSDRGPGSAAAIARDCTVVMAFLRQAHPEAAVAKTMPIRLVLDSGENSLVTRPVPTSGFNVSSDAIGILILGDGYGGRQVQAFRRELVKSGFEANKTDFPLWYRLGLKNIIAEVQVSGESLSIGQTPLTNGPMRFLLTGQGLVNYEHVFTLTESSPDYVDLNRRFLLERQATAFLHLAFFDVQGRYAAPLVQFLKDPNREADPASAFECAFGFRLKEVGGLVRNAAQGSYKYRTIQFRHEPAETTGRPANRSDVVTFRRAFE